MGANDNPGSGSTSEHSRAPAHMRLHDRYVPGLQAGEYRVAFQQSVEFEKGGKNAHHYYRDQRVVVQGPRFSIGADEIHSHFPPPGAVGDFSTALPHVVMCKRALPWERAGGHSPDSTLPWMALVLIGADELEEVPAPGSAKTVLRRDLLQASAKKARKPAEPLLEPFLRDGDQRVLLPNLVVEDPADVGKDAADTKNRVNVLDLPLETFLKICPPPADLPLLAHVRHVDTRKKEALAMPAQGEFSVVVCNRFPQPGENVAHLVSLEGWSRLWASDGRPAITPTGMDRVRLISLANWQFVDDAQAVHTFKGLMERLDVGCFGRRTESSGDAEARSTPLGLVDSLNLPAGVRGRLASGYVPLPYRGRRDPAGHAWYRGPITTAPILPIIAGEEERLERSDTCSRVDAQTGLEDISYPAAWQMGRLLGLASPSFSHGLLAFLDDYGSPVEAARRIVNYLELHRSAAGEVQLNLRTASDDVYVAGQSRTQIVVGLVDWLARLVIEIPVPFDYWIADTRLLPKDSLRFFHIDSNWILGLAAGALSIGIRQPRREDSRGPDGRLKRTLRQALSDMVVQHYLRRQEQFLADEPGGDFLFAPRSGFLLRSPIVSGWPGLEIEVEASGATSGAQKIATLDAFPNVSRLERIADDVFCCLARGVITQVTLTEPPEGLRFGVEDKDRHAVHITVRDPLTAKPLQPDGSPKLRGRMREAMWPGVLDIADLAESIHKALEKRENTPTEPLGSAALALQMLRMGQSQKIRWNQDADTP